MSEPINQSKQQKINDELVNFIKCHYMTDYDSIYAQMLVNSASRYLDDISIIDCNPLTQNDKDMIHKALALVLKKTKEVLENTQ